MHQNDQKQVICEIYGILDKHINVQIGFSMLNALECSFLSVHRRPLHRNVRKQVGCENYSILDM